MDHSFESAKPPHNKAHAIQQDLLLADRPRGARSTALFGGDFAERKRRPIAAIILGIWALLGSTQFFLEFLDVWQFLAAISSIPAALAAIGCFFYRPVVRVQFTEEGVEISRPYESLAYSEIVEVYAPDRLVSPAAFDIYLLHAYGTARIPKTIRANFGAIYDFLQSQPLAARENSTVPYQLQNYLEVAIYEFGSDKVFVYRSRVRLEKPDAPRRGERITAWIFGGGILISLAMSVAAMSFGAQPDDALLAIPLAFLSFSLLFGGTAYVAFMLYRAVAEFYYSFEKTAFLIVSPLGIAAIRNGKLIAASWKDLRDGGKAALTIKGNSALRFWTTNGSIRFRDNLNWPLRHAIEQIRTYLN